LENPEVKSQPTGVSTFAIRTSQITGKKLQKSFHLTDPKENCEAITNTYNKINEVSNFIFFSSALKNKKRNAQPTRQ
jgi:hypothetical protein